VSDQVCCGWGLTLNGKLLMGGKRGSGNLGVYPSVESARRARATWGQSLRAQIKITPVYIDPGAAIVEDL
jgi:hypothetical protein